MLLTRRSLPQAVVCANDQMAIGVLREFQREGIVVPADVALTGFDDVYPSRLVDPPLTTVSQPLRELGVHATQRLLARIEDRALLPQTSVLPTRVVIRASCGCVPRPRRAVGPRDTSGESITWYLNGNAYYTVTESQIGTSAWQAAVDHGFFLILDVAIGGGFPNGVCNCSTPTSATSSGAAMSVGYVAVYTTSGSGGGGGGGGGTSCTTTATADISADCYTGSQGSIDVTSTSDSDPSGVDSSQVAQLTNGDYLEYPGINFGSGSSQFDARVASGAAGGVSGLVEVVLDNPANAPVGSFAVANTGGWSSWQTIPANISTVTGTHTVYLEFSSGAGGDPPFVSLHYFNFPVS